MWLAEVPFINYINYRSYEGKGNLIWCEKLFFVGKKLCIELKTRFRFKISCSKLHKGWVSQSFNKMKTLSFSPQGDLCLMAKNFGFDPLLLLHLVHIFNKIILLWLPQALCCYNLNLKMKLYCRTYILHIIVIKSTNAI